MSYQDPFGAASSLGHGFDHRFFDLSALSKAGVGKVERLPYSTRVLLEAILRNMDGFAVTEDHARALAEGRSGDLEIPFNPGRVVLQDFTGVPAVVDLAALRSAMKRIGGDVKKVNPQVRADLVIDHSVQVDAFGSAGALMQNSRLEFERNRERYEFLKWGQSSFDNFSVVPPATGIVHQVNLEFLAPGILTREQDGKSVAFPDSLVGTDSHTTMINGLGVLGWGVGGIEAEAVMLGQPIFMLIPGVVGFELQGQLAEGATATDLVLTVTQMLRKKGVVGKFVEFFGPGLASMTVADRATIANMAPEYGATCGFFPVDDMTLKYMRQTGRSDEAVKLMEVYSKANGFWREDGRQTDYEDRLGLDLGEVQPSLAGPKRPQDKVILSEMKGNWTQHRKNTYGHQEVKTGTVELDGQKHTIADGAVTIAAITSCTNTSNPSVMVAAGLLARKAVKAGLQRKPWVKSSLAPGSRVVTEYFDKSGLTRDLEALGFHTVGYGCTTCIGNSGPLIPEVSETVREEGLLAAAVLSGNRNFEGRVNPDVQPSFLASPPLVVAYALAGTVDVDLVNEPLGQDENGKDVFMKDIWPSPEEVQRVIEASTSREQYIEQYGKMEGSEEWQKVQITESDTYEWDPKSTYVQEPPFFQNMAKQTAPIQPIEGAKLLVRVGDSVTTDHISPAGAIGRDMVGRHRAYLSRWRHRGGDPGWSLSDRAGGREDDVQQLRLPPGQRPGDDPGHLRQHSAAERARPRDRGRLHDLLRREGSRRREAERGHDHLRGGGGLCRRKHTSGRGGRQRLRHGLQPRLGRERNLAPGGQGGDRRILRADPPEQLGGHGCPPTGLRGRPDARQPGARRRGEVRHRHR